MHADTPSSSPPDSSVVSARAALAGKRLVVIGGTGFLGKVWVSLLLTRFPEVGHVYLVVRSKAGLSAERRFREQILTSEVFLHLRKLHGDDFDHFVADKVTPIAGDVSLPLVGTDARLRDELRGRIAAVVNVAGVVDFDPPLDEALEVNAFGCQNLVALARDLGDCPVLHTSTCFTAGSRTGPIEELDPREIPFPRAFELDRSGWDPAREIAECMDVIEQARHRASDAFRQSHFLDEATQNLKARDEPFVGAALADELARVRRRFVEKQLSGLGMERARFWGWPNTYTYTKSIGEQIVAGSGLPFCIVRPAIVESTLEFPFPGWNEGINTSSPFIFLIRQGGLQVPGSENNLDLIPCDLVGYAITLALVELLAGRAKPVYQAASSDRNPATMARFFELSGLHKRKLYQRTGKGGPLVSYLQSHFESALLSKEEYESYGPKRLADGAEFLSGVLAKVGRGPLETFAKPAAKGLSSFSTQQRKLARVMDTFLPFVAEYHYIFRTDNVRAAFARLLPEERELLPFRPEDIDWRHWFLEIHAPALERLVFPLMERRLQKKMSVPRAHESLLGIVDAGAERFGPKIALGVLTKDGIAGLSYEELGRRARRGASRLARAGVGRGGRVLLAGRNHPDWVCAFFAVLYAGATVVPYDPTLDAAGVAAIFGASGATLALVDEGAERVLGEAGELPHLRIAELADASLAEAPLLDTDAETLACLIYTSGTTGAPKGVMLSHGNLAALVAALSPLFPLGKEDRLLSVLPLHHTFELTCGLLLPLSRGARVVYLDELSSERLAAGLVEARATALIGVPALWEALARRIEQRAAERGPVAERLFDWGLTVSNLLGKRTGLDFGRLLFGEVHRQLGGNLKYLVSGGAALPESTHRLFQSLGLHLSEGYGLTEAAPVLTVAQGSPRAKAGHVGHAIPGVEIRIAAPNAEGVGEVLARGPNVMLGYERNEEATRAVLDEEGWLHTGDLGKLDGRGRLVLLGRAKDVVVGASGENLYPDDIEAKLGVPPEVSELCALGVSDGGRNERLVLVVVPERGDDVGSASALRAIEERLERLPARERPTRVVVRREKLPRTATRKVRRAELARELEALGESSSRAEERSLGGRGAELLELVARIARRDSATLGSRTSFRADLGFDSLQALELHAAIEARYGRKLPAEELAKASTVGELSLALDRALGAARPSTTSFIEGQDAEAASFELPAPVRLVGRSLLRKGQSLFYESVMRAKVTGRAHIPRNSRTLVVSNHASHLDMGLVKHALGSYGEGLRTLAAQDYFFEGHPLKKAAIEQLTNLVPIARSGSLRAALRETGELLDRGHTVLIFPEGTRSPDGALREFKASVGHLALHHEVDVLPVWLGGTRRALPKGAAVPRSLDLEARIGPPLRVAELRRLTEGLSSVDAARVVAGVARLAVQSLAKGEFFELATVDVAALRRSLAPEPEGLEGVVRELERRFVPEVVDGPISYYFSLGDERWTVRATRDGLEVSRGKTVENADCVLKTSPELFERIVREAYVPGPAEFMGGHLKTNNVAHLLTMQKLFRLGTPSKTLFEAGEGGS